MTITEPAPAKINLALHIRRKRPDGYHDLETLFAFARDGDTVTIAKADEPSLTITGPFASSLSVGDDNLVNAAVAFFRTSFMVHGHQAVVLEKRLPIASGIGGGSADAAATLRALARMYRRPLDHPILMQCAAALGADVPACLLGRTAFATGRGDELTALPPLGDLPLLLVNPGVPLSTAAMFAAWDGIDRGPVATDGAPLDRARQGRNDFTATAISAAPAVGDVLRLLAGAPGCTFARLSGSGATCFGIFADVATRDAAAARARARGWWVLATAVV
ncbi:4-(cytidine 5'-diphospho)-2-C-methyl-D-erythritol kinase [uncultured Sphingomonas sp.]|uniref:4-(cytidine 5'-diphospho)-2-C-methyl-D-erythritol kinase n=1 Tax=uncultured Sphingomonas sp. TaxID=158754 RepID=UPI0035C97C16